MIECDDPEGTQVEVLVMLNKSRTSAHVGIEVRCGRRLHDTAPERIQTFLF
jgi:hypothetical protein